MNPKLAETIYLDFTTHNASSGAAADADSTPTVKVFEDATDTPILTPTPVKRTGETGNYRVQIDCTGANGFEVGKSYNVVAIATVSAVTGKGVIGNFQIRARSTDDLAFPTISGRSIDVDATGGVEVGSVATDAINAGAIAAGAITSSEAPALANLDAAVSSRAAPGAAMTLAANAVTATALDTTAVNEIRDAIMAYAIETGVSFENALKAILAVASGSASGFPGAGVKVFKNPAGLKNRVTSTTDADGNRTTNPTYDFT